MQYKSQLIVRVHFRKMKNLVPGTEEHIMPIPASFLDVGVRLQHYIKLVNMPSGAYFLSRPGDGPVLANPEVPLDVSEFSAIFHEVLDSTLSKEQRKLRYTPKSPRRGLAQALAEAGISEEHTARLMHWSRGKRERLAMHEYRVLTLEIATHCYHAVDALEDGGHWLCVASIFPRKETPDEAHEVAAQVPILTPFRSKAPNLSSPLKWSRETPLSSPTPAGRNQWTLLWTPEKEEQQGAETDQDADGDEHYPALPYWSASSAQSGGSKSPTSPQESHLRPLSHMSSADPVPVETAPLTSLVVRGGARVVHKSQQLLQSVVVPTGRLQNNPETAQLGWPGTESLLPEATPLAQALGHTGEPLNSSPRGRGHRQRKRKSKEFPLDDPQPPAQRARRAVGPSLSQVPSPARECDLTVSADSDGPTQDQSGTHRRGHGSGGSLFHLLAGSRMDSTPQQDTQPHLGVWIWQMIL
jgi:hypothetical protein